MLTMYNSGKGDYMCGSTNCISFAYVCIVSTHATGIACFYLVEKEKAGQ